MHGPRKLLSKDCRIIILACRLQCRLGFCAAFSPHHLKIANIKANIKYIDYKKATISRV